MLRLLVHVYQFAEVYTVLLVWLVVPLGFFVCRNFFQKHFGMFSESKAMEDLKDGTN